MRGKRSKKDGCRIKTAAYYLFLHIRFSSETLTICPGTIYRGKTIRKSDFPLLVQKFLQSFITDADPCIFFLRIEP